MLSPVLRWLLLLLTFSTILFAITKPVEKIAIQLKWKHAWQFAGLYAAIEKGYFKDEGLDVELLEYHIGTDYIHSVLSGKAQYGVSDSSLLKYALNGKPVVVLAQIFQHSPLIFISHADSGIYSPYEMIGKKVVFDFNTGHQAALSSTILNTIGSVKKINVIPMYPNAHKDFEDRKIDVLGTYISLQPFQLAAKKIPINIIKPQNYGVDFYGDCLFTSKQELASSPDRAEKVRRATLRGWKYALEHKEEMADIIIEKYSKENSKKILLQEAAETEKMILPKEIPLGSINSDRCQMLAKELKRLGQVSNDVIDESFFYNQSGTKILTHTENDWVQKHPSIKVCSEPDWGPFSFRSKGAEFDGVSKYYLSLIAKRTGLKYTHQFDTFDNCLKKLKKREVDLVPDYGSVAKLGYAIFSKPYEELMRYFFIRDDLKISSLEQTKGLTLAIPKGYEEEITFLNKNYPSIKIVQVETLDDAIGMVIEKKADLLFDSYPALEFTLGNKGISSIIPLAKPSMQIDDNLYMISRSDEPLLREIINRGLGSVTSEEKLIISSKFSALKKTDKSLTGALELTHGEKKWLEKNRELTVYFNLVPPITILNGSTGEADGISRSYLDLISKMLGVKFRYVQINNSQEFIKNASNTSIHLTTMIRDNPLLEKLVTRTDNVLTIANVIVNRTEDPFTDDISDYANKTVSATKISAVYMALKSKYPNMKIITFDTNEEALRAVSNRQADAFVEDMSLVATTIRNERITNLKVAGKLDFVTPWAFGLGKNMPPEAFSVFNKAISKISKKEHDEIYDRWITTRLNEESDHRALFYVILGSLALFSILFFINRHLSIEIGRRKLSEEALQISREQLEKLFSLIPVSLIITATDGKILKVNKHAIEEFGESEAELLTKNLSEFYKDHSLFQEISLALVEVAKIREKLVELSYKQKDQFNILSVAGIPYLGDRALLNVFVNIDERIKMEHDLAEAKIKADAANHAKSEFLANMSHEIRTPMNAVIGFVDLLQETQLSGRQVEYVSSIKFGARGLMSIINDVLDLSKIEAGKITIQNESINLANLLAELEQVFSASAKSKGLDFEVIVDAKVPYSLSLDQARVRQILFNLVGNAIKFTSKGFVHIKATCSDPFLLDEGECVNLRVDIEDSGVGIKESQKDAIFEQFAQHEGQSNREFGGTGLGLSISKKLSEIMGGGIKLRSKYGEGSTFSLYLYNVRLGSVNMEAIKNENITNKIAFHPAKILLVDDIKQNRELIKHQFASSQLLFFEATNGREAVEMVYTVAPDLIVMDIRMPVMDGKEATAKIREDKGFDKCPIIAFTASVSEADGLQILSQGFNAYVRKPATKSEIVEVFMRYLGYEDKDNSALDLSVVMDEAFDEEELFGVAEEILPELDRLELLYEKCSKGGDFGDIEEFASLLKSIKVSGRSPIGEFVDSLWGAIEMLNIETIESKLKSYPALVEKLRKAYQKGKASE